MKITERKNKKFKPTSATKKVIRKREVVEVEEKCFAFRAFHPTVRLLKVKSFYRQTGSGYKTVPDLRLCGHWLEEVGFLAEGYASVTVMDGLLVIRATQTHEQIEKTCT